MNNLIDAFAEKLSANHRNRFPEGMPVPPNSGDKFWINGIINMDKELGMQNSELLAFRSLRCPAIPPSTPISI